MSKKFKPIKFPEDESIHNHIIEWWYFNGHLKDQQGREYAFMNCLFRAKVKKVKIYFLSRVPTQTLYFSHSIISDLTHKSFQHRITPFSIISDDSFSKSQLYVNYINPTIKKHYANCAIEKTGKSVYHMKNEDVDLKLTSIKKPLLVGGKGFLDFQTKTTYYYSLTNLKTEGVIKIKNKWIKVSGKSWMDHQWADASYSPKDKWYWFSIQLDDGTDIICFMYGTDRKKAYVADISYADGRQAHYKDAEIIPSGEEWTSPKSQAVYPIEWKMRIPAKDISLTLKARIKNQEILFGSINYWEGPIVAEGFLGNKKVTGVGFMELVGYPSHYSNMNYVKDEVRKTTDWFISAAKKNTFSLLGRIKRKITG